MKTLATPSSRTISRLKTRSAWQAIFDAAGCGLNTAVFPAATTLIMLLAIVGTEWVAGKIMPITPHGACSMMHSPLRSLRSSLCMASTPRTKRTLFSLSIL